MEIIFSQIYSKTLNEIALYLINFSNKVAVENFLNDDSTSNADHRFFWYTYSRRHPITRKTFTESWGTYIRRMKFILKEKYEKQLNVSNQSKKIIEESSSSSNFQVEKTINLKQSSPQLEKETMINPVSYQVKPVSVETRRLNLTNLYFPYLNKFVYYPPINNDGREIFSRSLSPASYPLKSTSPVFYPNSKVSLRNSADSILMANDEGSIMEKFKANQLNFLSNFSKQQQKDEQIEISVGFERFLHIYNFACYSLVPLGGFFALHPCEIYFDLNCFIGEVFSTEEIAWIIKINENSWPIKIEVPPDVNGIENRGAVTFFALVKTLILALKFVFGLDYLTNDDIYTKLYHKKIIGLQKVNLFGYYPVFG